VLACFEGVGIQIWVAGGGPRDWLEGKHCYDLDLAHGASYGTAKGRVGKAFPDGTWFERYPHFGLFRWGSEAEKLDFNILRSARQLDPGRSMFEQKQQAGPFLSEDALLRDFTFNALYFEPATGLFLDPTGRGLEALVHRTLELAGPAFLALTNPFLPLRAIKFMGRGYEPDPAVARLLRTRLDEGLQAIGSEVLRQWLARQLPPGAWQDFARVACPFLNSFEARKLLGEAVSGPRT
jgi:tRNA nucleotidyltransferase/poly(A) polymerase